ncbi:hypothetical protein ACFL6Q_00550 [Candidatus Neomarinimicrobiota bacterium]
MKSTIGGDKMPTIRIGRIVWPLVVLMLIGGSVNEINAQGEISLLSILRVKKVPEGARITTDEGNNICLENWPGTIRIGTARTDPDVALIYAEGFADRELEATEMVLWTRNLDRMFMVDSIKVRFSGCLGEAGFIPVDLPDVQLEVIWIDEIEICE